MKFKTISKLILFTTIVSCSAAEEDCKCNEYLKTTNGTLVLYGGTDMALCNGTVPNPSPKIIAYKKECK